MKILEPKRLEYNPAGTGPHKGDNGRVLVVAGSHPFVGAAYLASMAALRAGADVVTLVAPERVAFAVNEITPDVITLKYPGNHLSLFAYYGIKKLLKRNDVLLIGNGLGRHPSTGFLVRRLARQPILKVLDADAIRAVSLTHVRNAILTPHLNEFFELVENTTGRKSEWKDHEKAAIEGYTLLQRYRENNIILLKGETDYIIMTQGMLENPRGNPRMRVAGSGDVLAGTIAGVLAQTKQMLFSIEVALPALTETADELYTKLKGSYTASDLMSSLHRAIFK